MILTVTMNPSIDVSYPLESLQLDTVNRVEKVTKTAGGKGLNVTRVLHQLKTPVTATGVMGGFFGDYMLDQLDQTGITHSFTKIAGEARSSIAILHEGKQTEILEKGPTVSQSEQAAFLAHFKTLLKTADLVTISGSLAKGFPIDFYETLILEAEKENKKVLLDASGTALTTALKGEAAPYLIKPNKEELEGLLNLSEKLTTPEKIKEALSTDLFKKVPVVVVSLGADGAVAKAGDEFYEIKIPKINFVNAVGSGDSTIAGFAYGLSRQENLITVLKDGMTCGMLNAQEEKTGYINPEHFQELFEKIQVTSL